MKRWALASMTVVALAAATQAQEFALTPGWTARAGTFFSGVSPAANAWRSMGEAGAAFDFKRSGSQALAYALEARGVNAQAYAAMDSAQRQATRDSAREDIGHSAWELATLTAKDDLDKETLGLVSADLSAMTGRMKDVLDKDSLRVARVGRTAAKARIEGRTVNLAQTIAEELEADERADRLAAGQINGLAVRSEKFGAPMRLTAARSAHMEDGDEDGSTAVDAVRNAPLTFLDDEAPRPQKRYGSPWVQSAAVASGIGAGASWLYALRMIGTGNLDVVSNYGWAGLILMLAAAGLTALYVMQDAANPKHKKIPPYDDIVRH